ncbi:MAG: hypothetical protein PHR68_02200 [Candidatus Gracilibacteria bacterium]|nr:hypothetical protein [Candidatus Gracilibacteria bacterium]
MKYYKKNASILIWSILILTFISFSFIYISDIISKLISNSSSDFYESRKYDFLYDSGDLLDEKTEENYKYFTKNSYTGVLRNGESVTYSGITNPITFSVISGGGNGQIYFSGITSTGITNTGFTISDTGTLYIKNNSGFTNYNISSSTDFIAPKNNYIITKEMGGKTFIKNIGER